jgi:hypothetical protein
MKPGWMARGLAFALGTLGLLGSGQARTLGTPAEAVLYFFTTPEAEGGSDGARRVIAFTKKNPGQVKLRPVLLAHDWKLLQTLTERSPLTRTLKELEAGSKPGGLDIPLFDEEGLRLAERWQVRTVPAFVLVRGGRAHRTAGASSDLEELWECSK